MEKANPAQRDDLPDAEWMARFRRRLRAWYSRHARDLPWRRTRDPYLIWLSEIMLQQTQVATVIPYFERFVDAFPTVQDLACADEGQVLRLWEGLGYYRRARQLHKAAKQIVQQHQGTFPRDVSSVDRLPGVGRYTRGAILSIAFDDRQPILEANTIRLHSRLLAYESDPNAKAGQDRLWHFAEAVLPRKEIGTFNQALMELGSTICTPKSPRCLICPASAICPTHAAGLQREIPRAKRPTQYEQIDETAIVVFKKNRVLLRRCQEGERWAGLWDFPRFRNSPRTTLAPLKRLTGIEAKLENKLAEIRHGVTRYRITLTCHRATYTAGRLRRGAELAWVAPSALEKYPLSVTGRKISQLLVGTNAQE